MLLFECSEREACVVQMENEDWPKSHSGSCWPRTHCVVLVQSLMIAIGIHTASHWETVCVALDTAACASSTERGKWGSLNFYFNLN